MKCQRQRTIWFVTILGAFLFVMFYLHSGKPKKAEESALHKTQKLTEPTGEAGTPVRCEGDTREKFVAEICQREGWTNKSVLERHSTFRTFMYHDGLKIIYCSIGKTGSTVIRTLIGRAVMGSKFKLGGMGLNVYLDEVAGVKPLDRLPLSEIKWRLETYHKVVAVRHPMERLYSGFNDRLGAAKGKGIDCRNYRAKKSKVAKDYYCQNFQEVFGREVRKTSDLNFPSFLRLVSLDTEFSKNQHWGNYMPQCSPCEVHYDHIIKPETMEEDLALFLPKIGMPVTKSQKKQRMNVISDVKPEDKMAMLSKVYKGVPDDVMRDVEKRYMRDAEVFGYTWDSAQRKGRCNIVDQSSPNNVCC